MAVLGHLDPIPRGVPDACSLRGDLWKDAQLDGEAHAALNGDTHGCEEEPA